MRSIWKGPIIDKDFLRIIITKKNEKKKIVNKNTFFLFNSFISYRNITILPHFIDMKFKIYNGIKYIKVKVSSSLVGDKFGMYSFTRKKNLNRYKKWRKK
jgi:ribosomal protein S19